MSTATNSKLPNHIAVIMDGNGRWAKKRLMPRLFGHKSATKRIKNLVKACGQKRIKNLTLFAFSSENWSRPESEVSGLMSLLAETIVSEVPELDKNKVKLRFLGNLIQLNPKLQQACNDAMQSTATNTGLELTVALNYGGHWDIVHAAQKLGADCKAGKLDPDKINNNDVAGALASAYLPAVDLFIRTSNEQRISNYLLWQIAYAELYFPEVYFPDFDETEFEKALAWYANRERRFGKISEQLEV